MPGDALAVVIASAGSTNAGVVDDLDGLAEVAHSHGAWLHVDGAYGGGALLLAERRHLFAGLGEADSFIVDPHKWFFCTAGVVRAALPPARVGGVDPHPTRPIHRRAAL